MLIVRIQYTRTLSIRNILAELITFGSLLLQLVTSYLSMFGLVSRKKFTLMARAANWIFDLCTKSRKEMSDLSIARMNFDNRNKLPKLL